MTGQGRRQQMSASENVLRTGYVIKSPALIILKKTSLAVAG
jgi:hypothetical protein